MSERYTKEYDYTKRLNNLVEMIVNLNEQDSIEEIKDLLDSGMPPHDILDSCVQGMQRVGQHFETGKYFISALIMAGAIMSQATELLEPHLKKEKTVHIQGTLMLGTVAGDIHDLGKDLFATLARFSGISVIDLGVDVPARTFLEKALKHKPQAIGISCVLTTAWSNLTDTVALLHDQLPAPQPPIIIGGNGIDEHVCRHVKAEYWAEDASEGVAICHSLLRGKS